MAIRKVIFAVFSIALGLQVSVSKADECVTVEKFNSSVAPQGVELFGSSPSATKKLELRLNQNRARAGATPVEASLFLVGLIEGKDAVLTAVVGKDGCVIEKTVVILTPAQVTAFAKSAGVGVEDFSPIKVTNDQSL
jgi:hypothetical protein